MTCIQSATKLNHAKYITGHFSARTYVVENYKQPVGFTIVSYKDQIKSETGSLVGHSSPRIGDSLHCTAARIVQ